MKNITLIIILASITTITTHGQQQEIQKDLKAFRRVIASPRINVILQKGDRESIRLMYNGVSKNKINAEVRGKTLHLFLDQARKVEKPSSRNDRYGTLNTMMYAGVSITAFVTYTELELLEIRGSQELTVWGHIESDEFRLRAYGENEINFESLNTAYFKASLYGKNELKIRNGRATEQKYKLYGDNMIDTRELKSDFASASIFGEGKIRVNTSEEVRLDAFGEPTVYVDGGGYVNKRIVIGRTRVHTDL